MRASSSSSEWTITRLWSVEFFDQRRVVKELVGLKVKVVDHKDGAVEEGPEEVTLRVGERRGPAPQDPQENTRKGCKDFLQSPPVSTWHTIHPIFNHH